VEGNGVKPDLVSNPTLSDVENRTDQALKEAVKLLQIN